MANPRLSIIPLLQTWDAGAKELHVNLVLLPDTNPRRPLTEGWPTVVPPASAFEGATLVLRPALPGDPKLLPTQTDVAPSGTPIALPPPGDQSAILDELEARFRIVLPPTPLTRSPATRLGKYLPESYRASFPFVAPKTPLAFTDNTYHCALRCRPTEPLPPTGPPEEVSWPEALAFALRHPLLARALGLVRPVTVPVGAFLAEGGWLYFGLDGSSTFATQAAADPDFVRAYATRVPPLPNGTSRALFTPTVFPVATNAAGTAAFGNFDQALREASLYDDGFARVVHASQPRTADPIEESEEGSPPVQDLGLALAWDDEDILVAQNRAIGLEPDGMTPAPAPQVVIGYRVDVAREDDPSWRSLCHVKAEALGFGPVALGDLDWEQPYEIHPRQVNARLFLPIMFARWRGRSLVASTAEDRLLGNVALPVVDPNIPVGLEAIRLRWGELYRFRVRLADLSGGGPRAADEPDAPVPTQVARWRFRRYLPPGPPRIVSGAPVIDASGATRPAEAYEVRRPRLGYPEATFADIPNARARLIAQMQAALAGGETKRPELPDRDAEAVEIMVRVRLPAFDPAADPDGYSSLYSTYRAFPGDLDAPLALRLRFVDCARLSDRAWEAPPALPGPTTGDIEVPTARDVRIQVRCVTREDPDYFGNTAARTGPWVGLSTAAFRATAAAEPPLFAPVIASEAMAAVYMQPDPPSEAPSLEAVLQKFTSPKLASRLAAAVALLEDDGTLLVEPGRRAIFGCAGLKHHLPPDRSSLALTALSELPWRWLNVVRVTLDRDWTWQGLGEPALRVRRTLRAIGAPGSPATSSEVMTLDVPHAINAHAVRGEVDRTHTEIVIVDAFAPQLVGGLPHETEVTYEVEAHLADGRTETVILTSRLPVTTPPAQVPKVVSVGHAFSDYEMDERYASTGRRTRRLWIEFAEPPADTRDGYFARVLTSAPDPMLLPGAHPIEEPVGYTQATLDPELVRVVRPGQADDFAGLHAMQPLEAANTGRHYLVPLPPNLAADAGELFGFFTYEIRVGHRRGTASSPFWSTAQARFGAPLVLEGVQHPPPWVDCQVRRLGDGILASATFAEAVVNGQRLTARAPNTEMWLVLYCQVQQADGKAFRNVQLDRRRAQTTRADTVPRRQIGVAGWSSAEIEEQLAVLGLPPSTPLSVLAVELLPEPNGTFSDPIGGDLGEVRILRTSPLTAVDNVCC